MAIRVIRTEEDPVLRKISKPVKEVTPKIITLIDDMLDTMYEAMGVGLAAPQVGILKRIVVIDVGEGPIVLINPEILEMSEETNIDTEGCLSVPGYYGKVQRASKIKVRSLTRHGKTVIYEPEGFLARIFQHEMDHLYGHLFIEKATDLQKVGE